MTNRGDPKAIFSPVYGCDPDTDEVQIQLAFQTRETSPFGGLVSQGSEMRNITLLSQFCV